MYGNYFYSNTMGPTFTGSAVWTIIAFILAVVGGFLAYYLFVKNTKKIDNKFLNWLKRFLNFKEMLIEPILKVSYIILAIFFAVIISAAFTVRGSSPSASTIVLLSVLAFSIMLSIILLKMSLQKYFIFYNN